MPATGFRKVGAFLLQLFWKLCCNNECASVCACAQSGCGTVVLAKDQSVVHSPNYPQFYNHDCALRWVVYAPQGHIVKVIHGKLNHTNETVGNTGNLCVAHLMFVLCFSLTLLILNWKSQTHACMIPSRSWET